MNKANLGCLLLLFFSSGAGEALVREMGDPAELSGLAFEAAGSRRSPELRSLEDASGHERAARLQALARLGVSPDGALLEVQSGRWATLRPAEPLIPGTGTGNRLRWGNLAGGLPRDDAEYARLAWSQLAGYLASHRWDLGLDPDELVPTFQVVEGGALLQVSAARRVAGLVVRGAHFTAVINHGNLILLGTRHWASIETSPRPAISAQAALAVVSSFAHPWEIAEAQAAPRLEFLPLLEGDGAAPGKGYRHHLVWALELAFASSGGRWEALVDAHTGELLSFTDLNHYGTARNVNGGVYPASNDGVAPDGIMVSGYPMPFADLDSGGFADSGGNFDAAGPVTTTLVGQFVAITEGCGPLVETSSGDLELEGTDGDTDCAVPPGHSAGDTAGARTAYYELNRIRESAAGILPANAWLGGQLPANVNIDFTCGASWNGVSVNFYRNSGSPCANAAEVAGVVGHEWGHGLDDNDVQGSIPGAAQGGGEGVADLFAALRGGTPCVGRGFFTAGSTCNGYGDPCTPASGCTGVRTVDYADRLSGLPHTLTWVRANCPSNDAGHCRGAAYSEAVWDLMTRDLPTLYGMDANTALEVTWRLFLLAGGNVSGWFDFAGPAPGDAGCGATQAYLQFLAADDDDGDLGNGTPHMTAIAAAFDRLEIGCTPGGATPGPVVQDSGCAGTPSEEPVVAAVATDQGAKLSWSKVPGAAEYKIYRTDGERQCELGKTLVGSTVNPLFTDGGLQDERPYYYVVLPMGAGGASCFGPASACVEVGPTSIFADGFESGDTSAWAQAIP